MLPLDADVCLQFSCISNETNRQTRSSEDTLMQEDVEDLETTAHVTAAHSSAFTPRKRKHYTKFTTQSYRDWSRDMHAVRISK